MTRPVDALLAAAEAAPGDDGPRLVLADALLEAGEVVWGTLIQLQCRLATQRTPELEAAERQARATYLAGLRAKGVPRTALGFDRGLVVSLTAPMTTASLHGAALAAAFPLLRHLALSVDGQKERGELRAPTDASLLRRARSLRIKGRHPGRTLHGLGPIARLDRFGALGFEGLEHLGLASLRVRPEELAQALGALPRLGHLELELGLRTSDLQVALQGAAPRHLTLRGGPSAGVGLIEALRRTGVLEQLEALTLVRVLLGDAGVDELVAASPQRLRRLELRRAGVTGEVRTRLARTPLGARLEALVVE